MEREHKFKVWDSFLKKIYWPHDNNPKAWPYVNNGSITSHKGDILMQYIGLKDKNGIEMYHKDILKLDGIDEPVVINWSYKCASFCLDKEGWIFSHFFNEACNPDQCEVIGNVYTNPELI